MSGLKLFLCLMLTSLGILFIKIKLSSWSFHFTNHPIRAICYLPLEKSYTYVSWLHFDLDQILWPIMICFVYALEKRLYAQMKPMLLKYCLQIVLKKREREMKRWHAKEAWPKKKERGKMACQRSMTQQIKSDMKRSMYLSVQ